MLALVLALPVLGATVVPPLLDAGPRPRYSQIESEHDPLTCAALHDHAICIQVAGSLGLAVAPAAPTWSPVVPEARRGAPTVLWTLRPFSAAPSPRAPPSSSS